MGVYAENELRVVYFACLPRYWCVYGYFLKLERMLFFIAIQNTGAIYGTPMFLVDEPGNFLLPRRLRMPVILTLDQEQQWLEGIDIDIEMNIPLEGIPVDAKPIQQISYFNQLCPPLCPV
jgi:hypothetical protein